MSTKTYRELTAEESINGGKFWRTPTTERQLLKLLIRGLQRNRIGGRSRRELADWADSSEWKGSPAVASLVSAIRVAVDHDLTYFSRS